MVEAIPPQVNIVRRASALTIALLVLALPAAATTVVRKDLHALCTEADLVFSGTVSAVSPQWADSGHRSIETMVTFSDLIWLRGPDTSSVSLRFAGGQIGDRRVQVVGLPAPAVGDRVVVFARRDRALSPLVGFSQGYFRVVESATGPIVLGIDRLRPASGSEPIRAADADATAETAESETTTPLPQFLDRVRRAMVALPTGNP